MSRRKTGRRLEKRIAKILEELPNYITLKTIEDSRKGVGMEEIAIEDLGKEKEVYKERMDKRFTIEKYLVIRGKVFLWIKGDPLPCPRPRYS
ncbi:MAG: hypothetical protein DRP09_21415, partial [Candidatus Thorarchaeota archaeon]